MINKHLSGQTEVEEPAEVEEPLGLAGNTGDIPDMSCGCSHKTKTRSAKENKDLMNRLKRIEGQVRGIQGMLDKDAYCTDVLIQVAAVNAALNSFSKALLSDHLRTCVADNIRAGNDEIIDELVILLQKLMK